jgi:hypothetical protein
MLDLRISPTRYIPNEEMTFSIKTVEFLEISSPDRLQHQELAAYIRTDFQGICLLPY